ncbi:MAG: homoserine O-acetyltransferase, partial [Chthoniobacterales bacterium]
MRAGVLRLDGPLALTSGEELVGVELAYETYGDLNASRDNAVLVFHAMTGNQHAAGFRDSVPGVEEHWTADCHEGWWDGFIGSGKALDTDGLFVICVNYLGGCYGSTGPASVNPATGRHYGKAFPRITLTDIAASHMAVIDSLGIDCLHAVVGASVGGMLALEVATRYPDRVRTVIPISTGLAVTPLQRILNLEQAFAIESDPNFRGGDYYDGEPPDRGLALARMIAHKTFISLRMLSERARGEVVGGGEELTNYTVTSPEESYMLHAGRKFVRRFDANSYLRILEAWQRFDLLAGSGASDLVELFERCRGQRFLTFSIDSDVSFYPEEQAEMVAVLKSAGVETVRMTVHSEKGHDSFLLEPEL